MKNKIAAEFAIGIILLIAILIAGIFWLQAKKQGLENQYKQKTAYTQVQLQVNKVPQSAVPKKEQQDKKDDAENDCSPHYYEGEALVSGWLVSKDGDPNLVVQIKKEDIEKLPTTKADSLNSRFAVTLIDPTDEIKNKLAASSEENPVQMTIHGYARNCKLWPQVSLQQATIAFKKNS